MPLDKSNNGNASKPFTPSLSSKFRSTKSPLTPRLAGSAPTSPALPARKDQFGRTLSPGSRDDQSLSIYGNITPRSVARKSRVGTESPSTPSISKTSTTPGQKQEAFRSTTTISNQNGKPGVVSPRPITLINGPLRAGQANSPTLTSTIHRRVSGAKSAVGTEKELSTKFFRAGDAKSAISSPTSNEQIHTSTAINSFHYGASPRDRISPTRSITKGSSNTQHTVEDKFVRANEVSSLRSKTTSSADLYAKRSPPSTIVSRFQAHDGGLQTKASNISGFGGKSPSVTTQKGVLVPKDGKTESLPSSPDSVRDRRKSLGSNVSPIPLNKPSPHKKAMSVTTFPTKSSSGQELPSIAIIPRFQQSNQVTNAFSPTTQEVNSALSLSPDALSPRSISLASSNTKATSVTSDPEHLELTKQSSVSDQIPESAQSQRPNSGHFDEAANARRERKVLDLEISNSSLLAINKTLERELKKQSTELRRFRRLSRSGRFSFNPADRIPSGQSIPPLDSVSEWDDEDEEAFNSDEDSDSEFKDDDEESLASNESGSATNSLSRARQRARDERRLMLDLSKHQQMLIDSQKLSQSIRRCLTCTEELIKSGHRALDYKVGIGDVTLGGRVLSPDELDDKQMTFGVEESTSRQGLLSPALTTADIQEKQLWVRDPYANPQNTDDLLELADHVGAGLSNVTINDIL